MSGGLWVYFAFVCSVREVHPTFPALGFARACTDCVDTALSLFQLNFFYLDSAVYCLIHPHIVIWWLNTPCERKERSGRALPADLETNYSNQQFVPDAVQLKH